MLCEWSLSERALGDPKGLSPTGDLFCKDLFIIKIRNMKEFIKENWFKIILLFILIYFVINHISLNRYYFINEENIIVTRCDNFTGECKYFRAEK